jgi:predicted HD phosphohydrolase
MATSEAEAFQSSPVFASAIALRRIDEEAKLIDAETAGLDAYRDLLFDLALNALRGDDQ